MTDPPKTLAQRAMSGGAWAFAAKVGTGFITVLFAVLVTRVMSPTDVGAIFLSFSIVAVASTFVRMGQDTGTLRLIAEAMVLGRPGEARRLVMLSLALTGGVGLLVAVPLADGVGAWLGNSVFSAPAVAGVSGLIACWLIVHAFQLVLPGLFRGFNQIALASVLAGSTVLGGVLSGTLAGGALFVLWLIQGQVRLDQAILSIILAGVVGLAVGGALMARRVRGLEPGPAGDVSLRGLVRNGFPIMLASLSALAVVQADVWIIGMYRPENEVALYAAPARLVKAVTMVLLVVTEVISPMIAELHVQGRREKLQRLLRGTCAIAAAPALVVLAAFVLFGKPILVLLFGDYYGSAALIVALLSIGQCVNALLGSCGICLIMSGNQIYMMAATMASGLLMIGGCLAVVGPYGATGVAAVTAAALSVQKVAMLLMARWRCGVWTHADFRGSLDILRTLVRERWPKG